MPKSFDTIGSGLCDRTEDLSRLVKEAIDKYIDYLINRFYYPAQVGFDTEEVREHIEELLDGSLTVVLDRRLPELRKIHEDLWKDQEIPAEAG